MLPIRQRASISARRLGGVRPLRRYASGKAEEHHSPHGSGSGHDHHNHAGPVDEPLGLQFYVVLALIPASYALYLLSQPSKDGTPAALTRLIDSYSYYKEKWAARNDLHTAVLEKAAFDKHLFYGEKGSSHINLKFPEIFNTGSPINVPAGQGGGNLEKLVAHYEKLNAEAEEKKVKALAEKASRK